MVILVEIDKNCTIVASVLLSPGHRLLIFHRPWTSIARYYESSVHFLPISSLDYSV